jgi:hypothetical protein
MACCSSEIRRSDPLSLTPKGILAKTSGTPSTGFSTRVLLFQETDQKYLPIFIS